MSKLKKLLKEYDAICEEAAMLNDELKPLQEKYKAKTAEVAEIESKIDAEMQKLGIDKAEEEGFVVSYRKSTKTVVSDESLLPDEVFEVQKKVSLSKVKELLQSGKKLKGAVLETVQNLQIKAKKDGE